MRDELLDREVFANLTEAQVLAADYREQYNHHRPHGALGYVTPLEFAQLEKLSGQKPAPSSHRNWYREWVRSSLCRRGRSDHHKVSLCGTHILIAR